MISKAVLVAMSAMALMGCGSSSGKSGTGGATTGTGGGSGGGVGPVGTGGSTEAGAGGIPGSGGNTGQGGYTASGGGQSGGAAGRGGAGGGSPGSGGVAGKTGGGGALSDAAASNDTAVDASQCPICPTIRCAYGSPVDENGCTVCICNPAPDGAIDATTDGSCALPEGCTGTDAAQGTETGGSRDLNSADAIRCGNAICPPGTYCCNPLMNACAPAGAGCGV